MTERINKKKAFFSGGDASEIKLALCSSKLKRWLLAEGAYSARRSCSWRQPADVMHPLTQFNALPLFHRTFGLRSSLHDQRQPTTFGSEMKEGETLKSDGVSCFSQHQELWKLLKLNLPKRVGESISCFHAGNHLRIVYWIHLGAVHSHSAIYGFVIVLHVTHTHNCIAIINPLRKIPPSTAGKNES